MSRSQMTRMRPECVSHEALGSAGMVESMQGLPVTDEPDVLETLVEEEHGDVDGDGTSSLGDEDLPCWAQRSAFLDGELPRNHTLLVALHLAPLLSTYPPHQTELKSEHFTIWPIALCRV